MNQGGGKIYEMRKSVRCDSSKEFSNLDKISIEENSIAQNFDPIKLLVNQEILLGNGGQLNLYEQVSSER
jgi:hypothetical protein